MPCKSSGLCLPILASSFAYSSSIFLFLSSLSLSPLHFPQNRILVIDTMLSQSSFPARPVPPIIITTSDSMLSIAPISSTPEKKKRSRRVRKAKSLDSGTKPKKSVLLDELGDALVDQFYIPSLDHRLETPNVSVVDHLRTSLHAALISDASSVSSSRALTAVESHVESTPPTSLDDRDTRDHAMGISISASSTVISRTESKSEPPPTNKNRDQGDVFCFGRLLYNDYHPTTDSTIWSGSSHGYVGSQLPVLREQSVDGSIVVQGSKPGGDCRWRPSLRPKPSRNQEPVGRVRRISSMPSLGNSLYGSE